MNIRLICVTFSLLVVFLSLGEGNNEVETKLQPQNAILTRNEDQILQRDARETSRKNKEKTRRKAKKSKPKKKGKHRKNKKRSNVRKSKQKFKKSTKNKTRKNQSLRRKKIRKIRKLKKFQRKIGQKAGKCGRQNTTNALDETCLSNLVNSISFERDQVTNFVAQYNRIKNFVKLVGNKAAKKGDFSNSTSTLLEALGGNGSNPACAGQRMTRGSRNAAVDSYKKLSNCSSTIETSCQIPNDTYSPPALDTCNTTYQEIKAKNKECTTKTTQQDNACACWAQAIELVTKAKNSTCDGKKPSDAVRKLKVACISTFSGCKKAEDASIGYIVTCRTCNSSAGECDLTTPAEAAANVTTAAAVVTTAAVTAGGGSGTTLAPSGTTAAPSGPTTAFSGNPSSFLVRRSLGSYPLAVCNDGTTAVYYAQENTAAAKKMVVFLRGGGACFSVETCNDRCSGGEDAELCTAPTDEDYSNSDTMWSNDPKVNPPFHDFFKVNVPYCSSDAYSGTRAASAGTGNYVFHGKFIIRAIIEDLIASNSWLSEATQIVLIGSSAGSFGVAKNCDEIAERFRQINANVDVRCIMDGGDFYPYTHYTTCNPLEEAKKPISFWQAENDKSCGDAAECNIFGASFEHVSTPFMVLASQQDRIAAQPFCTPDPETPGSEDFWTQWKTEMVALANKMIQSRPESGLHISGCPYHVAVTQPWIWSDLKVTVLDGEGSLALKDLIHNWLTGKKPIQTMDPAGVGQGCQK